MKYTQKDKEISKLTRHVIEYGFAVIPGLRLESQNSALNPEKTRTFGPPASEGPLRGKARLEQISFDPGLVNSGTVLITAFMAFLERVSITTVERFVITHFSSSHTTLISLGKSLQASFSEQALKRPCADLIAGRLCRAGI